jgi:hypothetical protein
MRGSVIFIAFHSLKFISYLISHIHIHIGYHTSSVRRVLSIQNYLYIPNRMNLGKQKATKPIAHGKLALVRTFTV